MTQLQNAIHALRRARPFVQYDAAHPGKTDGYQELARGVLAEIDAAVVASQAEPHARPDAFAEINAKMLATLREIRVRYSPFGRPGALIDETIRQAEGR